MSGRVLITGASGALGHSVVRRFLTAGSRVLAVGTDEAALAELAPLAPSEALSLVRADLTDSGAVDRLFADAAATSGTFPAVVHLVGGFRFSRLAEMSDRDWSFLLSLNLETTFRIFRA